MGIHPVTLLLILFLACGDGALGPPQVPDIKVVVA
jgi:hypothetical protein